MKKLYALIVLALGLVIVPSVYSQGNSGKFNAGDCVQFDRSLTEDLNSDNYLTYKITRVSNNKYFFKFKVKHIPEWVISDMPISFSYLNDFFVKTECD